jgi:hypothetical protein
MAEARVRGPTRYKQFTRTPDDPCPHHGLRGHLGGRNRRGRDRWALHQVANRELQSKRWAGGWRYRGCPPDDGTAGARGGACA